MDTYTICMYGLLKFLYLKWLILSCADTLKHFFKPLQILPFLALPSVFAEINVKSFILHIYIHPVSKFAIIITVVCVCV